MTNYYEVLGVEQDAGDAEIKKAYRVLSLKYHPDRNSTEEATTKIQQINEAYEVLSDKGKRNQHDMELRFGPGMGPMGQGMNDMNDINNIFNMVFGQGFPGHGGFPGQGFPGQGGFPGHGGIHMSPGGPEIRIFHSGGGGPGFQFHHMARPEPIQKVVQITIAQSFTGCTLPIDVERTVISNNTRRSENETVYINIPQGIDDNETVTLHEKGNIINDTKGEIRITFRIQNNSEFKRKGLDLIYQSKISLKDALCGFSFELVHLNGKRLCLNNNSSPTVIKPNYKKVVPNLGMTRESNTGNMIIDFEIEFPETLTLEQIESLRNIL
jgi:DnaJ-class molecular chaperone